MYIIDTCEKPFSCYNRCDCYYTFDFKFVRQGDKNYPYKIVLSNPRENEPLTVSEGIIKAPNDYYYWNRDKKIPLELLPAKKYILANSPEDTTSLKERLITQDIQVGEFVVQRIKGAEQEKHICWAIVEGKESLPDLTHDEAVLYEGPFFLDKNSEREIGGLTELFSVMLKQAEDLPLLEQLAAENNVTIFGHIISGRPLLYWLDCTKASKGNAMELANQFHETGLFECTSRIFKLWF
jgi:hypothetical protein